MLRRGVFIETNMWRQGVYVMCLDEVYALRQGVYVMCLDKVYDVLRRDL